jgi:hypothetical protein
MSGTVAAQRPHLVVCTTVLLHALWITQYEFHCLLDRLISKKTTSPGSIMLVNVPGGSKSAKCIPNDGTTRTPQGGPPHGTRKSGSLRLTATLKAIQSGKLNIIPDRKCTKRAIATLGHQACAQLQHNDRTAQLVTSTASNTYTWHRKHTYTKVPASNSRYTMRRTPSIEPMYVLRVGCRKSL